MFDLSTRFLVVDDFSTMRKIIKKVLNELGYTNIMEATDGKMALDILKEQLAAGTPVQVVISDWTMPKMTGIELLRACREASEFKLLPILLVTAENEQQHILEAAKAGVSEYVVKPFSAQIIKEKLGRVFQKHNPEKRVG